MKLIPLTQGKFAKVDDADFEWLSEYNWYAKKNGPEGPFRAARSQRINGEVHTFYMAREIMKCPSGKEVDHKDRDELNNQRENLRVCTRKENLANRCF